MKIEFTALVKEVKCKALASLDKGWEVKLQGEDPQIAQLTQAPADGLVKVVVEWQEKA